MDSWRDRGRRDGGECKGGHGVGLASPPELSK